MLILHQISCKKCGATYNGGQRIVIESDEQYEVITKRVSKCKYCFIERMGTPIDNFQNFPRPTAN